LAAEIIAGHIKNAEEVGVCQDREQMKGLTVIETAT
jgi:hypothetical protein